MVNQRLPIRRVHTGDRVLDDTQRAAQDVTRKVNDAILAGGVLLHHEDGSPDYTGLAFTIATPRSILHGLGRKAIGWMEVYGPDLTSAAHVGLRTTAHPAGASSDTHVTVTPAATGSCFLFVF